ncbi:MAG: hypothetical protein J5449_01020 [Oscillospiraceae bacterium]|nr:hypothetical protein [Oscillospiraceae bacterium]
MDRHDMQRELRRNENTLVVAGLGIAAFGVWSIVKMVLMMTLQADKVLAELDVFGESVTREQAILIVSVIAVAIVLVDMLLRLYVGLSARKDGLGGKKKSTYIVVLCIMIVVTLFADWYSAANLSELSEDSALDTLASLAVELTSTVVMIELAVAAIKVRKLRKKLAEEAR